jgi:hypothetical protein
VNETNPFGPAGFDDPSPFPDLPDRLFRTNIAARPAAVAQLGKNKDGLLDDRESMIGANLGTPAAVGAEAVVDLRNGRQDLAGLFDPGLQEKMSVRFLHIAVQELDRQIGLESERQVDGDRRFASPALSAGHGNDHRGTPPAPCRFSSFRLTQSLVEVFLQVFIAFASHGQADRDADQRESLQ